MEDAKCVLPPSKKRVAGREISRDNPGLDDDDEPEGEMGTFKRASDEVLAARRIVKVRRQQPRPSSSSNPFAGLQLMAPSKSPDDNVENANVADEALSEGHGETDEVNNAALEDAGNISGTNADDVEAPMENSVGKSDMGASKINNKMGIGKSDEAPVRIENDKAMVNGQGGGGEETDLNEHQTEEDSKREAGEENAEEKNEDNGNKETIEVGKEGEKLEDLKNDTAQVSGSFSSFQQLSCRQNAFSGLAGTGLCSTPFSFGLISKEGSAFTTGSGSLFGQSSGGAGAGSGSLFGQGGENLSNPSTLIGNSSGSGSLQLFGSISSEASTAGGVSKPVMQEVPVETGEENEMAVFNADAILFEYVDSGWKERGKGELKLNITTAPANEKARLVMRARGNYRLILNANLFPDMSLKGMDKRGVTFACINSATEGRDGFSTFALKFREASILEDFCHAVEAYKGKKDDAPEAPADSRKLP